VATATQWLSASRPRTLPAAIAPVLVGSGAGFAVGHLIWWKALLVASFVAYLPIPPLTWRFLENLHEPGEQRP